MSGIGVGVIGCGNMGGAILAGLAATGKYRLYGWTRTMARLDPLKEKGVSAAGSADDLVRHSDVVVLGVKPWQVEAVLSALDRESLRGKTVVSIAAGIGLATLKKAVGGVCGVVRCMPNTPAQCGKGVFALSFDAGVAEEARQVVWQIFSDLGLCLDVPEAQFTAFSALVGAGPAYVFDLMEGMVMAGVTLGFSHSQSRKMVEALFEGCACMARLNPGEHLIALRDNVCSPAGLTIAGVNCMNEEGISAGLARAVFAANKRGREMED